MGEFINSSNFDGGDFIKRAPKLLFQRDRSVDIPRQRSRKRGQPVRVDKIREPKTFSHFVMNLPATAIDFLPAFRGIYSGCEESFYPFTATPLPLVHLYCFEGVREGEAAAQKNVCRRINESMGYEMRLGNYENYGEISLFDIRDVAPLKRYYCATFRLPATIAFAKSSQDPPETVLKSQ